MDMKNMVFSTLSATLLVACGGSGGGIAFIQVPPVAETAGPSDVEVEITPSGETITVVKSGGAVAVGTDTTPDVGTFRTAVDNTSDFTLAFISTGDGSVAGGTSFNDGGTFSTGVFYARTGTTDVPTSGSATFAGDYVGVLVNPATEIPSFGAGFTADATLTVDFDAATVAGAITDRSMVFLISGAELAFSTVADMTLEETTLAMDGSFAGAVTGGGYTSGMIVSTVSPGGTYEGLIAGASADEAVGAVLATHTVSGGVLLELGTFAAGH